MRPADGVPGTWTAPSSGSAGRWPTGWMSPPWWRRERPPLWDRSSTARPWGSSAWGAIGSLVANMAIALGMDVYGLRPLPVVNAALRLDRHVHVVQDIKDLYRRADYITMHIHYTKETERMIGAEAFAAMKPGVRLVNLARGGDRGRRGSDGGAGLRPGGRLCDGFPHE